MQASSSHSEAHAESAAETLYRNELEIQFLGLQRSGNHAVLSWLFQQFGDPVYFFNNVKHFGNPLVEFQPADLPNTIRIRRGASPALRRRLDDIGTKRKKALVYSYENLPIVRLRVNALVPNHDEILGRSVSMRRLLVVREFYNWIASRTRYFESTRGQMPPARVIDRFVSLWIMYAREFLGETRHAENGDSLVISYNRWVEDERYRRDILERLGIAVKDNSNRYVPAAGGGSSFDGTAYCGRPEEMQVNERWPHLLEEKCRDIVVRIRARQKEIDDLNFRAFGASCPF
jgi:hypothetical protein